MKKKTTSATAVMNDDVTVLKFPDCIRERSGMYIGGVDNADVLLRETIDNAFDESYSYKDCNKIVIEQNWNGYNLVMDNGRGIPIRMSPDIPTETMASVAVSNLHAGSKFGEADKARNGQNGIGSSAVNALSETYVLLSRVTEQSYTTSLSSVKNSWKKANSAAKKEMYYFVIFSKGIKVMEGAGRLSEIELKIFGGKKGEFEPIPRGYSTIVLFRPDPSIFDSVRANVPFKNIQYFLLIQEKFYKKKVEIVVNGVSSKEAFQPYRYEFMTTIIPADTSKNKKVDVYVTFEPDQELRAVDSEGSVSGLVNERGVHINWTLDAFREAMKSEYKLNHDFLTHGLKICVIILAGDVIFDSQTKTWLRSITRVKSSDFAELSKNFQRVFRSQAGQDEWEIHSRRLTELANSMKKLSTADLAEDMIKSNAGASFYRTKQDLVKGFAEATAGPDDRWNCELFLCFPGHQEVLMADKTKVRFDEIHRNMKEGTTVYYTMCSTPSGAMKQTKVSRCEIIAQTTDVIEVTLSNDVVFECTPDHKVFLIDGSYKEAGKLKPEDIIRFRPDYVGEKELVSVSQIKYLNLKEPIDVYCLEVEAQEHNFSLAGGLFVKNCEGNSAGGSLTSGRKSTMYHAVMPLRGKVLNVSEKTADQAMVNKEIYTIYKVLGLGLDEKNVTSGAKSAEEAYELLKRHSRYGKLCIACDADPDGLSIQNSLLYTFSKFSRFLLDFGMVYIVESPIYEQGGKYYYPSDPVQKGTMIPVGINPSKPLRRFKGLGSLNKSDIYDSFYNPDTRRLFRVTTDNIDYSMKLMEDIAERKRLLTEVGVFTNPYGFKDF